MLVASVMRVLDDVVAQAVGSTITDAFARLEHSHAHALDDLAARFETALERQDKRHCELLQQQEDRHHALLERLLERQDVRLREILTNQASAHADDLRALLRDVQQPRTTPGGDESPALPTAIEELQETTRLGFGEVRAALDRGHHEWTKLRIECVALTTMLSRLSPPAETPPTDQRRATPPPAPRHNPTPARSPPIREDRAAAQRRLDALHDDDDGVGHDDTPHDPSPRPLRYCPPDDDAESSHPQEASA